MKTRLFKTILALTLALIALPMMGQDFMNVYFKDGTFRTFQFNTIVDLFTSIYDSDGIQYMDNQFQHVRTKNEEFVCNINDIDSITFTKYYEEQVKANIDSALPETFNLLSGCENILDVNNKIDMFKELNGVEDAWCVGNTLFIKISGWHTMSFVIDLEQETEETEKQLEQARAMLTSLSGMKKNGGEKLKAVIANARDFDFDELEKSFRYCYIDVTNNKEKEIEIPVPFDFYYDDIYNYDLIFLFTHGSYYNGQHWLLTSEKLGSKFSLSLDAPQKLSDDILKAKDEICEKYNLNYLQDFDIQWAKPNITTWAAYACISEECIDRKSEKSFPSHNSILFNGACESLMGGNSLANIYLDEERGLGIYFGYNNSNVGSATAGKKFFTSLLTGKSVRKAYDDIPEKFRNEEHCINPLASYFYKAKLLPVTNKSENEVNNLFLFQTHTNQIPETTANEQFNNTSFVEVEGITRTHNPDLITLGFVYGTGENFVVDKHVTDVELKYLGPSNESGNYLFTGKLTGLEQGKTYGYRAYAYDGLNYNFGDICYFTLKEPFNPDQEVTQAQYEAAKSGIEVDGTYHIYTQFNGTTEGSKKYYLKDDGHLTDSEEEAHVFTFGRVEGSSLFVSPGWKLDIPFSNPHLTNGATGTLPLHGQIRVDWDNNRNDWEGQVWYKNGDYYAVRSTNAVSEQWGASTFWTVLDSDANGMPEADYSLTPKFVWQLEKAEVKENPRDLMLTTESEGTTYSIYRQVIDKKDIHTNPDKWITYRSLLTLDITKNGTTTTYTLDDNIYLEERFAYNEGQHPCIILNYQTNEIGIFCVSKDAKAGNFTMDGYYYTSPMNSISFNREKVFGNDNWGWYPYFTYEGSQLKLQHFSYNGYYAMTSTRKSGGSWSTSRGSYTKPDTYKQKSLQIGHVLIISGSTDPVNTDCPARVVSVDLNSTEYHRNSSYPNQMYFSVNAKLDDMTDVTEWGVYFDNRPGKKEFAFESVSAEQTKQLYYNGQEGLMKVDVNSYVAQLDDEVGVYVKKLDKTTGTQKTLYSNLFSFKLLYDKKPSMVISNPVIVKTEITGVSDGKNQYRTDITHDYTLTGAFWISYIDSDVSGNDWTFKNMNTNWYPETDGSGQLNWVATYDDDTNLPHTNWRVLHLRNNKTINSNYVNFSGNKVLTEAWVSDSPVYTARIADRKNNAKGSRGYISLSIPEESSRVSNIQKKQEVPYKGGYLGAY